MKCTSLFFILFCFCPGYYAVLSQGRPVDIKLNSPVKIAVIGASITYGVGTGDRKNEAYPAQLQKMLGRDYEVHNYGVSGTTMLLKGNLPYNKTKEFQEAIAYNPDIVFIDLGGNDSKLINRVFAGDLEKDCHYYIETFSRIISHPRIIVLLPLVSFVNDTAGIYDPVITHIIIPHLREAAFKDTIEIVDMHSLLINESDLFPDKIHPNSTGASIMAGKLYRILNHPVDSAYDITNVLPVNAIPSSFYGFQCRSFKMDGHECKVVQPKRAATGHPWIWRARFWGHEPQTDIALLEQGFHVVYCDVAELMGNRESINIWNRFYDLLNSAGLSKKAAMEGMSRGAVYAFNWATSNPKKVSCIYVDNPLLNIRTWAEKIAIVNPDDAMFLATKKAYHLKNNHQLHRFSQSPLDKVKQIIKGNYPILILCADADEAVSPDENTNVFEQKIKALKGDITVIHKPGFKHHPHSLPNPKPIVDFILKATADQVPQNRFFL